MSPDPQGSLFAPRTHAGTVLGFEPVREDYPRARSTDPETSHAAARAIPSKAAREATEVLTALRANPGCTSRELAAKAGGDRYVYARRLPELRDAGLAENSTVRMCCESGRQAMTWRAVE